jgi:hypothetical protein
METKICTRCWLEKPIKDFHKSWWWRRHTKCKPCKILYYTENKEEYNNKRMEYRKTEKWRLVKLNERHRRRQMIKTTNDWSVTQYSLDDMLDSQKWLCNICWCNIQNREDRHLDHIYPLSKWWLHTISNLQWLCVKCNLSKGDSVPPH